MNNIEFIKEPIFWLFTAIGSIVLSVIANLFTPKIQQIISKYSQKKRKVLEEDKKKLLNTIINIEDSQLFRTSWQIDAVLEGIKGVGIILLFLAFSRVVAILPFWEARYFVYPILAIGALYGYRKIQTAVNNASLTKLADARDQYIEERKEIKRREAHGKDLTADELIEVLNEWDSKYLGVK